MLEDALTTEPPRDPAGLARRGIRVAAIAGVALVVTAAGTVTGDARRPVLAVVSVALAAVAVGHWRSRGRRSGIGTSAAVAAALVAAVLAEDLVADVDLLLWGTGLALAGLGTVLDERRLVTGGLVSLGVALGRPLAGGPTFAHCLVATDVAVGVPRLDGPMLLSVAAIAVGTLARWSGWRRGAGRGFEATGAVGLVGLLLAKSAELPGHRLLCGPGDAVDEGWVLAGIVVGLAAVAYGLAGRDALWAGAGVASLALQGVVASSLNATPWWAVATAVPIVAGMIVAERRRVDWPDAPGYGVARPGPADVRRLWRG